MCKNFFQEFSLFLGLVFSHYVKERSNNKGNFNFVIQPYDMYYALLHIIPSAVINFNFFFVKIYYLKGTIFSNPCYAEL